MRTALYWSRATRRDTWRAALAVALLGGLLGAVALGALAGRPPDGSAYGRYLASINASDAFVNIPGCGAGHSGDAADDADLAAAWRPASAGYIGLYADPVVPGRVEDAFLTNSVTGTLSGASFTADGFGQDRMTVLAAAARGRRQRTRSRLPRHRRLVRRGRRRRG